MFAPRNVLAACLALILSCAAAAAPARAAVRAAAPPPQGAPILIVESYSTTPDPVRSGQRFTLNVTVRNTGTKHADDIYASVGASSFVGLGSPALVGKLDPEFAAAFSLQVQAPPGLSTGAVDLPIAFLFRIGESPAIEVVRTVGIRVSGGSAAGRPQVVIEAVAVGSPPAAVGDQFEATLTLRNVGARRANDVTLALTLNDALSPAEGSGTTPVGDLEAGQSAAVSLRLVLDQTSASGRVLQTIKLDYADSDSRRYTSEETVAVDLGTAGRRPPQLIVAAVATRPERPAPGDVFQLQLQVANVGAGDARRLLVRLGDEAGLAPFAPLASSNVRFVPAVAAGETVTLTQAWLVDGAASGGAYAVRVSLAYENTLGEAQTETEVISLLVLARPKIKIGLTGPLAAPLLAGEPFDLPVEVINIGRQTVNVSTVELISDQLELTEASVYLGPLDAGTSGSLVAQAVARAPGAAQATVVVSYLDEFNQEQTVTEAMTFSIEAAPEANAPVEQAADLSIWERIWQAILGFFGLG